MVDSKIDYEIKEALKLPRTSRENISAGCLSDEQLAEYVTGVFQGEVPEEQACEHINECDSCFEKVALSVSAQRRAAEGPEAKPSKNILKKVKDIPGLKPQSRSSIMKRNRYLFIAALFFSLSFFVREYFMQFLVAAVIFGLKWIMDTGGTRALIMVYDAWQKSREKGTEEGQKKMGRRI